VPLPVGNGEQFVNAASLVTDGRAEVIDQKEFTSDFIATHIDRLLHSASQAPVAGDDQDLDAAQKIVALTDFAMKS
jgi:UDP-N-acetylglucosamine:LPS N-acetylglucosamine transferase